MELDILQEERKPIISVEEKKKYTHKIIEMVKSDHRLHRSRQLYQEVNGMSEERI